MPPNPERRFSRADFALAPRVETLSAPSWKSACVVAIEWQGETWVVKDFRPASRLFRLVLGPILTARELRALEALRGLPGVPADAFRIDSVAFAYRYAPGESVRQVRQSGVPLGERFFPRLEALVNSLHRRGRVHLDLRNGWNMVATPHHEPLLVDFQSSVSTRRLPRPFRRLLEEIDLSGVYKWWIRLSPATLDEARAERLRRIQQARRFWPLGFVVGLGPRPRETAPFDTGGSEWKRSSSSPSTGRSTTRPREGSSRISASPWRSWARAPRASSRNPNGSSPGS
jgi:hypothetical protein